MRKRTSTRNPATCRRKDNRHDSYERARDHRNRLIAGGASPTYVGAYHCRHCDCFHVGRRIQDKNEYRYQGRRR